MLNLHKAASAAAAYTDGGDDRPVHLGKPGMHEHEAVKQLDELRQDSTRADATTTLFIVQTTDAAGQLTQQLQPHRHAHIHSDSQSHIHSYTQLSLSDTYQNTS